MKQILSKKVKLTIDFTKGDTVSQMNQFITACKAEKVPRQEIINVIKETVNGNNEHFIAVLSANCAPIGSGN
jgi:hypothetical protein